MKVLKYIKSKKRQSIKNNDTLTRHTVIPIGSMAAVKREDSGPQMNGTMVRMT